MNKDKAIDITQENLNLHIKTILRLSHQSHITILKPCLACKICFSKGDIEEGEKVEEDLDKC